MKRILLISYNFNPEPTGIGKYNGEMIAWLVKQGYHCSVITAYPYYPFWKVQEPYYKRRFRFSTEGYVDKTSGGELKIYRCPLFVPEKPSGLKRILLDFSFLFSAFFRLLIMIPGEKFDFVITVAPSFQVGFLGVIYKKIRGTKLLYHIQDMQIEAARDLKMIKSEKVVNVLFSLERFIFANSDIISSISDGMVTKIREKAGKEPYLFPNWTSVDLFYPIKNKKELKEDFGFQESDKIILYSGAIGEKQGLDAILHAADEMREKKDLKFVICGQGPYKENLQVIAASLNLPNLVFMPLQPFEKFNRFLNMADVHLVIQKANASDLVMPSKLTTILAVGGLALVTANKGAGLHTLIDENKMGVLVDAENQQALNAGILKAVTENLSQFNLRAREYAENVLAFDKVMASFESQIHLQSKRAVVVEPKSEVVIDNALRVDRA
jgi:colanic acid biosynthesis glycosyl transferase WcaI